MRKIGEIANAKHASVFSDYLYAKGIANNIEGDDTSGCEVWVHDEEALQQGREELERFCVDPENSIYGVASREAESRRREEQQANVAFEKNVYDRYRLFRGGWLRDIPVTRALIVFSVLATLFGGLGSGEQLTQWLSITAYQVVDGKLMFDPRLPEIARGQVWRLVTPIFLHAALTASYGLLHILFNMLWLKDIGGMIEKAEGGFSLVRKVVLIGVASNLLQFVIGGPMFGGMSGVVYGLLGYVWLRGRLDVTSGLYIHGQTMLMMTFWFFLCLSGAMGPIANAAHAGGLISGLLWGYLAAWRTNTAR